MHRLAAPAFAVGLLAATGALLPARGAIEELRGVWVDRSTLVSRESIRAAMRTIAAANLNLVFVNAWSRGYPLWPSDVFEKETGLRTDPGFGGRDVMREALEEATAAGLAMMPWVEYGFIGGYTAYHPGRNGCGPIFDRHPDWLARTRTGQTRFAAPGGEFCWMVQARPDVQEFLLALMAELAARYQPAGIQFDRARYPTLDLGYDDHTVVAFRRAHGGADPPADGRDPAWVRWRADGLNAFLAALSGRIKAAAPDVLLSNAPITFPYGYDHFAQDYPGWLRAGSLDFVVPQIYRRDAESYARELDAQIAAAGGTARLAAGIDVTNSNAETLVAMIEITRRRGVPGVVLWYHRGLEQAGAYEKLRATVFADKAMLPARPARGSAP